jgi:hypothetical protein
MAHIKDRARTCLDTLLTLYDNEIILFRSREWDDYTRQIVKKIQHFVSSNHRASSLPFVPTDHVDNVWFHELKSSN